MTKPVDLDQFIAAVLLQIDECLRDRGAAARSCVRIVPDCLEWDPSTRVDEWRNRGSDLDCGAWLEHMNGEVSLTTAGPR
ncbi:hypothetical protein SMICM304S_05955 [Streptomyces microflavus]